MSRIVAGINPVAEAIKARPDEIEKVLCSLKEGPKLQFIKNACREKRIRFIPEEKRRLDEISGNANHQGVAAMVSDFSYCHVNDIIENWKKSGKRALVLVLDGIEDPQNLGAIIRSAESAGVNGIIIPKNRAASVTSTVEKVSAGAVEHVKIAMVTNTARTIEELKAAGLWIAGADATGDKTIYETDLDSDLAVVVGSESKGMRPGVKKSCDFIISIPMHGKINSLNASVSTALIIFEAVRQRKMP